MEKVKYHILCQFLSSFPLEKRRRGESSMYELKGLQQAKHIQQAFQNGKVVWTKINSRGKQFSLQDRSKRSIFLCVTVPELKLICRFALMGNLHGFLYLCFELGPTGKAFSKLMKIRIALLRLFNIRLVIYLGNILLR